MNKQFFDDIKALDLLYPVAEIAEKTGFSRGNVSEFLRNKREPSKAFLNKFYEVFNVPKKGTPKEKAVTFERLLPELMGEYEERFIRIESQVEVHHLAIAELQAGDDDVLKFLEALNKQAQIVARRRFHELGTKL